MRHAGALSRDEMATRTYARTQDQTLRRARSNAAKPAAVVPQLERQTPELVRLQRALGNRAVNRLLCEAQSGIAIQRKEPQAESPAPANDAKATTTPATNSPAPAKKTSTPMKIKASYEELPGASSTGAERSKAENALWFNPLTIASLSPSVDEVSVSKGVTRGGGQLIETYNAPLNQNPAEGTGMISAQLQYAKDVNKSYSIKVSGLKGKQATDAQFEAKKFVAERIKTFGDFEEIQQQASAHMEEKFPGSQTVITVSSDQKVMSDAGRSKFFYKARANPTILLEVPVTPVAEKTIHSGSTTTKSQGSESQQETHKDNESEKVDTTRTKTDQERHGESSVEKVQQEYNEAVVKTLDDMVTNVTTVHDKVKSELVQKTVSSFKYHDQDAWETHRVEGHFTDYTKNVKGYTESGDKEKRNWAWWLQKGVNIIQQATEIPFITDIPKIGKYVRKVKGWGIALDLIDKVAGTFAETGKVKYTDSKEDTTVHEKGGTKDDTSGKRDRDVTGGATSTTTANLEQSFDSTTNTEWKRHMTEATDTKKSFSSVTTKDSSGGSSSSSTDDSTYNRNKQGSGGSDKNKQNQSMTTTMNYDVSAKETYTKPYLKATVVDGDGEVSATPFTATKPAETEGK